ncbi:MAG TPA: alpha/beta fold hydrolase [Lautropia sp.]|nr:alpha/beta fold hydrolase [Lautropia sp.]
MADSGRQAGAAAPTVPERPTLVLLHGIGGNAAGLAPVVSAFSEVGWPALAWSQPGYDGTPLVEPYDLGSCARALGAWLGARESGAVVLVGHSMGGMLAQTLSAQVDGGVRAGSAGFRIAGLVLAHTSSAFGHPGGDFQQRFIASRTRPLDQGRTMRDIATALVPTMMAPTASAETRDAGVAMMAAVPPETYRLAVSAVAAFDGRAHLEAIQVPTLCLAAEHDTTAAPAVLQRMSQRIPGADYQCLEALGHLAPIEDPARWAAAVGQWCDRRIIHDRQEPLR